LNVAKITTNKF